MFFFLITILSFFSYSILVKTYVEDKNKEAYSQFTQKLFANIQHTVEHKDNIFGQYLRFHLSTDGNTLFLKNTKLEGFNGNVDNILYVTFEGDDFKYKVSL